MDKVEFKVLSPPIKRRHPFVLCIGLPNNFFCKMWLFCIATLKQCSHVNSNYFWLISSPVSFSFLLLLFLQTLALHDAWEGLWFGDRGASPWKDSQVSWESCWGMMLGHGGGSSREVWPRELRWWNLGPPGLSWAQRSSRWHSCTIMAQVPVEI